MRKKSILSSLIFVFLLLIFLNSCKLDSLNKVMPEAENGTLDLSAWDFEKDGPVALNGEWEFYWHAHWTSEDFSNETPPAVSGYIKVPGTWNGFKVNGEKIPGAGYASYRLKIHLAKTGKILAFKVLDMAAAFSMYVNGEKLVSAGIPAKTPQLTVPQFYPQVVEYDSGSKQLEVVILVSNFHHRKGGAWEPILLGLAGDIWKIRQKALNINFFLFGGILMMGFYHIGLFIFRTKEKSTLFFGIFCFLIAIRSLVTGERYLINIFPDFNWEIHTKIAYLTFYSGVPVFAMYFQSIFPREFPKYLLYLVISVGGLFSGIVLFTPAGVYTHTAPLFQIFTLAASFYAFYILVLGVKHKQRGAFVCMAGFVVLFLTIVNDILYSNLIIQTGYMIQVGFFVFIFSQASLLSLRFSRAFTTVESQHRTLEETNAAYMNEIVERKRTEQELRESEKKFRTAFSNANIGFSLRMPDGRLVDANTAYCSLSGYSVAELRTLDLRQLVHPDDVADNVRLIDEMLAGRIADFAIEDRYLRKNGEIVWVRKSVSVVRREAGKPQLMIALLEDITGRKQAEDAFRRALAESRKLNEELSQYAYAVTHDLKAPLRAVRNYAGFLYEDLADSLTSEQKDYLSRMKKALTQGEAMIADLLKFSRIGYMQPEMEKIDVPGLLKEIRALINPPPDVEIHVQSQWPEFSADRGLLRQILQNLITNAIKFNVRNPKRVEIGWQLAAEDRIEIFVCDNGIGIKPQYRDQIFQIFRRLHTNREYEGTGIGLAIVQKAAQKMGGSVNVKSDPENGSTFFINLPKSI